jgi:hypothetical protein
MVVAIYVTRRPEEGYDILVFSFQIAGEKKIKEIEA